MFAPVWAKKFPSLEPVSTFYFIAVLFDNYIILIFVKAAVIGGEQRHPPIFK
jgi:hypothetical protein